MKISQREARRLRKRNDQLERALYSQRSFYGQQYFGGVEIAREHITDVNAAAIRTARKLKHAVVVVGDESSEIRFMALPHSKELQ